MSRTEVSQPIAENLIKVGAFDDSGTRSSLLQQFVSIITIKQRTAKGTVLLPEHDGSELNSAFEQPSAQAHMDERDLLPIDLSMEKRWVGIWLSTR